MRVAVLIAGYLRGFKNNIESLQTNILNNYDCDIYIHITDTSESKYINDTINIEYIKHALNPKLILISKNINFENNSDILNQNHKYYWLNEERKRISNIENIKYDAIIKIRPDTYLNNKINVSILDSCVYIPTDAKMDCKKLRNIDDPYICDIIAYGNEHAMNQYFNYYLQIDTLINKYQTTVNETLLYYYLYSISLKICKVDIQYCVLLSKCNVIAITGDSGAGKSTLANILKDIFVDNFVLECDRYHKWERNDENWKQYTHLNPNANYITKMCNDVFDLKVGNSVYQVDYDHSSGKFTDKHLIESKNNIIVCGLHSLYTPEHILNLKIFIDTDDNLRIPWKLIRDVCKRGHNIEYAYQQILNRKFDYDKYILPQKEVADIIINYYTDIIFDINNFNLNMKLPVYLKIIMCKKYSYNYSDNEILNIVYENDKTIIYYKFLHNYSNIIYNLLIHIKKLQ